MPASPAPSDGFKVYATIDFASLGPQNYETISSTYFWKICTSISSIILLYESPLSSLAFIKMWCTLISCKYATMGHNGPILIELINCPRFCAAAGLPCMKSGLSESATTATRSLAVNDISEGKRFEGHQDQRSTSAQHKDAGLRTRVDTQSSF